ncbi:MAG: flagellar hook-basal body complex protein FliE [Candidatus Eremiobacteraeota bacterium]|nr:flagellar hook-basal body complex protein FliE [Candidatus Eremiobacteraeota bacterium]
MTIVPLVADEALPTRSRHMAADATEFGTLLDGAGRALSRADGAEDAFAAHAGSLQDAVFERAQADVVLSVATATAQRTAQAMQSILNMQI